MVGIVIVSHSAALAEGVAQLAREMGGPDVAIQVAGGMDEPDHPLGTDAALVKQAIDKARGDDGVVVLMDLGSAVMSAEMAVDMLDPDDRRRVVLSDAPLVEGAVAAAATAKGGASLDEVASEARAALRLKASEAPEAGDDRPERSPESGAGSLEGVELRLAIENPLGLHARPAARFVSTVARYDADVTVTNETTGRGPVSGRSLSSVATLGVRQGHDISVRARGPEARPALDALRDLAARRFGDAGETTAGAPPAAPPRGAARRPMSGSRLPGVSASPGVAVGPARPLTFEDPQPSNDPPGDPEDEWHALRRAIGAAREAIDRSRQAVSDRGRHDEAGILEAHLLMLEDDALLEPARRAIYDEGRNAGQAWAAAIRGLAGDFESLEDEYQRARAADVVAVGREVLGHLAGTAVREGVAESGIVIADDLSPVDTAALDREVVKGLATARGGPTSHSAILARALAIPAVVGLGDAALEVLPGTSLVVDGDAGVVFVDPDAQVIADYERRRDAAVARNRRARVRAREPARSRDGRRIEVMANIGVPDEAMRALDAGAEGVGLLRTEFLFLDRAALPDEDEQFSAYSEIAAALKGRPVVIRTLDVGADKPLRFFPQEPEANPFLGIRGLRLGLSEPKLLATQLRAVVRAAQEHPVKVMFPMVAALEELRAARALVDEACRAVGAPERLEVGIMVEVPSAALTADRLAPEVDFFSIGTNDLTQYTMAAERGNSRVASLNDPLHPAVLSLVHRVVEAAEARGRWTGVCGEVAADPVATPVLVGLGVTELSMGAGAIPAIKEMVRDLEWTSAAKLAHAALSCETAAEVRDLATGLSRQDRARADHDPDPEAATPEGA